MGQTQLPHDFVHPFSSAGRRNPYPALSWLRRNAPLFRDQQSGMHYATDHATCAQILHDPSFSAARGQRERRRDQPLPALMLTTDPPEHSRLRAPGRLLLGPAAVREHENEIAGGIRQLVTGLSRQAEPEATGDLGYPFAALVLGTVLRIPVDERPAFAALARQVSVNLDPLADPATARAGRQAMGLLTRYLDGHVNRVVAAEDGSSLRSPLGRLARDGRLARAEMLGILALTVVGGYEPLACLVGNALTWLLPRPAAVAGLAAGDAASGERAVDEFLRLESPIPFVARVTTQPVPLPAGQLPAGARVLAVLAAANRDPAVFGQPDDLRLDRAPNPHLAFGFGPHFCLGASLVRSCTAMLLESLALAHPGLRIAPGPPPEWAASLIPHRVGRLPLALA